MEKRRGRMFFKGGVHAIQKEINIRTNSKNVYCIIDKAAPCAKV